MPKKQNRYLEGLARRREEAARQEQPEEASEPEAEAPQSRVLQERAAPLWPSKKRRPYWS